MRHEEAESVRKRYLYRRLIMTGKIALPPSAAVRLIGPDCAYHLYSLMANLEPGDETECGSTPTEPEQWRTQSSEERVDGSADSGSAEQQPD